MYWAVAPHALLHVNRVVVAQACGVFKILEIIEGLVTVHRTVIN